MRILVLSAFEDELRVIQSQCDHLQETMISKCRCWIKHTAEYSLLLSLSGVGTSAAAITTTILCEHFKPDLIVFCGVAGGMRFGQRIGDLVLADRIIDADLMQLPDILQDTPYRAALIDPHTLACVDYHYSVDSALLRACMPYVDEIGSIVTSNLFPTPKHMYPTLKALDCRAIEMESSGIFKAAQYYATPVLTIRAISNLISEVGDDLGTPLDALSVCATRLADFFTQILPVIIQLSQFKFEKEAESIA
ncbi:MAG: hypothetical protein CK423_09470 [Legionella sp.]|nr:MAG: hypothetical protein CK423_09470 [Legionella sp.]